MAVKIRLKRIGAEGPGVPDCGGRFPIQRDGKPIEELGYYDPTKDPAVYKVQKKGHFFGSSVEPCPRPRLRQSLPGRA